ncbi:FAD-dependent oxidoreductase [Amycolatopsis sp. NEAU-NG30]|uniref:FAD-dependent oxidoreductase n=1 Tax=Amycolatopsis melonis TaxID=3156488 RepID=A0ABV0LFD7_9PSEU
MTLVVVGASLAGLRAVESARRTGYRGRIVLVGAEEHLPYDRPPLSKAFLAAGGPRVVEPFHSEEVLRGELGVELMLGAPAESLDTDVREVTVAGTAVRYDALVIATGATARRLPGAHSLRTAEDAFAVRAALDRGARTVVVGAGFIGAEVASAARARGLPVTIVEAAPVPLARAVGETAGAVLAGLHHAAGTDLRLGTEVEAVVAGGVRLAGGEGRLGSGVGGVVAGGEGRFGFEADAVVAGGVRLAGGEGRFGSEVEAVVAGGVRLAGDEARLGTGVGGAVAGGVRLAGSEGQLGSGVGGAVAGGVRLAGGEGRFGSEVEAGVAGGVRLVGGEVLPADLVVAGIGAAPATGWLEGSGVPLHPRDRGVVCDATLAAGPPGVYAAGDVAHVANPLFDGEPMRLEHWTSAAEQGAAAARHALDPASARAVATVPYFWSDWYGHRVQFVGTPHADEVVTTGDVTLYRRGERIVGALTVDRPREIMKYRRRIAARGRWAEALDFAGTA